MQRRVGGRGPSGVVLPGAFVLCLIVVGCSGGSPPSAPASPVLAISPVEVSIKPGAPAWCSSVATEAVRSLSSALLRFGLEDQSGEQSAVIEAAIEDLRAVEGAPEGVAEGVLSLATALEAYMADGLDGDGPGQIIAALELMDQSTEGPCGFATS